MLCAITDTATTEINTLSLHDALPISRHAPGAPESRGRSDRRPPGRPRDSRSEEHTSELQSQFQLVCRLLLEKKKRALMNLFCVTVVNMHSSFLKSPLHWNVPSRAGLA